MAASLVPIGLLTPPFLLDVVALRVLQADKTPVSVFVFDLVAQMDRAALGRNAMKRCKTLRHPSILPYLDGLEVVTPAPMSS